MDVKLEMDPSALTTRLAAAIDAAEIARDEAIVLKQCAHQLLNGAFTRIAVATLTKEMDKVAQAVVRDELAATVLCGFSGDSDDIARVTEYMEDRLRAPYKYLGDENPYIQFSFQHPKLPGVKWIRCELPSVYTMEIRFVV